MLVKKNKKQKKHCQRQKDWAKKMGISRRVCVTEAEGEDRETRKRVDYEPLWPNQLLHFCLSVKIQVLGYNK